MLTQSGHPSSPVGLTSTESTRSQRRRQTRMVFRRSSFDVSRPFHWASAITDPPRGPQNLPEPRGIVVFDVSVVAVDDVPKAPEQVVGILTRAATAFNQRVTRGTVKPVLEGHGVKQHPTVEPVLEGHRVKRHPTVRPVLGSVT